MEIFHYDRKEKRKRQTERRPNKPKMELITERQKLMKNADAFEIFCKAEIVAQENEDFAVNGLRTFNDNNGAVKTYFTMGVYR